jgi:MFS family permease
MATIGTRSAPRAPAAVAAAGLTALGIAMGIGRFAFTPILPMMQQDAGLTVADGGWLASANYLGYLVGALLVSAIALRVRPETGIRGGLAVISVTTLAMGVSASFAVWMALRTLAGIASAAVLVFASAWCLERLAAARRPLLNGAVFAGVGTGIAVAGSFCLVLMEAGTSSAWAWTGLGAIALAATAVIWPVFGAGAPIAAPVRAPAGGSAWSADAVRLMLCYGAFGFGYIIPGTFLPVMARQAIHDPLVFGSSWPVFGAAAAISTFAAALWSPLIGYRRLWIIGALVMAFGVGLPLWRPGIGSIMIAALLVGGTFMVITQAGMQEARTVGGPRATRLMGAMTAAFAIGQVAGPICVSALAGRSADFTRPLLVACVVLLASAVALGWAPARAASYDGSKG